MSLYATLSIIFYINFKCLIYLLNGIRSALPNKSRSKVDDEIKIFTRYKNQYYLWPISSYEIIANKNVEK